MATDRVFQDRIRIGSSGGARLSAKAGRLAAGLLATALLGACAATGSGSPDYEIWALDQGTHTVHVYDAGLTEIAQIDMEAHGARVPHMIDFTDDYAYAVIANPASRNTAIVRTSDRAVVAVIETGPGSHMASLTPGDGSILVAVIGDGEVPNDGEVVEIVADWKAESFEIGRRLVIAEDPLVQAAGDRFGDIGAVCQEFTADGRFAYVSLGPSLANGGLVVLDMESFTLARAFPPDELKVNCGTLLTPDGKHMLVNGGSGDAGLWYALDTGTHEVVRQGSSGGRDAHGVWATPNGREIWMVNRVSSNGIVLDASSLDVIGVLDDIGKTPDIVAMSPDSRLAFISLRGPNPVTAHHVAVGETPGFAVVSVPERRLIGIVQPAEGDVTSDFHGIGVRYIN
jgi:DNA-binding beta-propeller fold protein YncE